MVYISTTKGIEEFKLIWITGSNCSQTLLCAFYHLRIVLMAESIVHLQNQMAKYTRKQISIYGIVGLWNLTTVGTTI